jgi:hypothetical protein
VGAKSKIPATIRGFLKEFRGKTGGSGKIRKYSAITTKNVEKTYSKTHEYNLIVFNHHEKSVP